MPTKPVVIEKKTVATNIKPTQTVEENQKARRRRASALSLKKIHNKLSDIDQIENDDYTDKPKDKFSEIQLVEIWTAFGKKLEVDGELNMASIVNANKPVLKNGEIVFALPNKLMEDQMGAVKPKLMNYLRSQLNNYGIQLKTIVVATERKKYVYTPQEKFQKLAEENPDLLFLKNKFGLDI